MLEDDITALCKEINDDEGTIVLLETGLDAFSKSVSFIMKGLIKDNDMEGIVIAINRPYKKITSELKEDNIDFSKISVIDMISTGEEDTDTVKYLKSAEALSDCSMIVTEFSDKMKSNKKFIFVDSISTLLIYNNERSVAKFIHHLTTKMRMSGMGGIFCLIKGQVDLKIRAEIGQLFDKVVSLDTISNA